MEQSILLSLSPRSRQWLDLFFQPLASLEAIGGPVFETVAWATIPAGVFSIANCGPVSSSKPLASLEAVRGPLSFS